MQHNIQQRTMDLHVAVVVDKAQLPKFVHENVDPRPSGTHHLGKRFLTDLRADLLRSPLSRYRGLYDIVPGAFIIGDAGALDFLTRGNLSLLDAIC
jgi:hypothetical protein